MSDDNSESHLATKMTCLTQTTLLIFSFLLYLLDQATDALTSLLFLLDVMKWQLH